MAEGSGENLAMVNTGQKEVKQMDVNPNSTTFGQTRWINAGEDLALCPMPAVPIYGSLQISDLVFRNNCGANFVGGSVVYTVPAGQFTSYGSQAAANALAQAYFDANAQTYANANAACVPTDEDEEIGGGDA